MSSAAVFQISASLVRSRVVIDAHFRLDQGLGADWLIRGWSFLGRRLLPACEVVLSASDMKVLSARAGTKGLLPGIQIVPDSGLWFSRWPLCRQELRMSQGFGCWA